MEQDRRRKPRKGGTVADQEKVLAAFNGVLVGYESHELGEVLRMLGTMAQGRDKELSQVVNILSVFNEQRKNIERMEEPVEVKVISILSVFNERRGDLSTIPSRARAPSPPARRSIPMKVMAIPSGS